MVNPSRGQNTVVPLTTSIPCSCSSNGGEAHLSPEVLVTSPRDFPKAMQEGWDQAVLGHVPTSPFQ